MLFSCETTEDNIIMKLKDFIIDDFQSRVIWHNSTAISVSNIVFQILGLDFSGSSLANDRLIHSSPLYTN